MGRRRLHRKLHVWSGVVVSLPLLLLVVTGALLLLKKHWSFVQPPEQRGSVTEPAIGFDAILAAVRSVPGNAAFDWTAVDRIDARPGKGLAKVRLENGTEIQVDLADGTVLQVAERRTGLIEALHDGSWFAGDWTKLGVMLPACALLTGLIGTGVWMWWRPIAIRRRVQRQLAEHASAARG